MKNNLMKIFIVARSKQEWQRLSNLVGLVNGVEIIQRVEDSSDTMKTMQNTMLDVLILDIDLPRGEDIVLLKNVHMQYPALAIIVLSYFSSLQYRSICEHAGATYFFDRSTEFQQIPAILMSLAQQKYSKYYVTN
jgi:DNA-binding NarL/FixJ family response regulator